MGACNSFKIIQSWGLLGDVVFLASKDRGGSGADAASMVVIAGSGSYSISPELRHLQQLPVFRQPQLRLVHTNTTLFRASTGRCMSSGPGRRDNP